MYYYIFITIVITSLKVHQSDPYFHLYPFGGVVVVFAAANCAAFSFNNYRFLLFAFRIFITSDPSVSFKIDQQHIYIRR